MELTRPASAPGLRVPLPLLLATLAGLGLEPARVRTEVFGATPAVTPGVVDSRPSRPQPPPGAPGSGPAVTFVRSDLTVNWGPGWSSLLELAEACQVPARWSCRTGVCQTCRTGLLSGSVSYVPDPVEPPADGEVLVCCAQPATELVLDL